MRRAGTLIRMLFVMGLALAGISAPVLTPLAGAQGTQSYQSPMTGVSIDTTGPWTIDTTATMSQDGIESVTVMGEYEFMQIWFMPGNTDLVAARDIILDSFETTFGTFVTIDRGAYGNVSYSLDMTSSEGIEFGVFSLFLGQRSSGYVEYYVYFGALPVFANGFASAQQNVRVGGETVFNGVDGGGLQNLLSANEGATGVAPQTGTTTVPPTPAPTQATTIPPTQPPVEAPTALPTEPVSGQTGQTSPEGDAYIENVRAETLMLETSLGTFLEDYLTLVGGTATDQQALLNDMNTTLDMWAAYPQTAAQIVAPAGYEEVDAAFQQLARDFASASTQFRSAMDLFAAEDSAGGEAAFEVFLTQVTDLYMQIETINGLLDQSARSGTTSTTSTTSPPEPTQQADTPVTGGADQDEYITTVAGEVESLQNSIALFNESLELIASQDPASQDTGSQQLSDVLNYWGTYNDVANSIVAPAGYEDIDAAYREIASGMPGLVLSFVSYLEAADQTSQSEALDAFSTQLDTTQTQLADLQAMLEEAGTASSTTTTSTTTEPTSTALEATEPAEREQTTAPGGLGEDAYLETVSGEVDDLRASFNDFADASDLVTSNDTADQDAGLQQMDEVLAYWGSYGDVAAEIQAPSGYEDVDAAYQDIASDVPELVTLFMAFLESEDDAASNQAFQAFNEQFESVQSDLDDLETMLEGGASSEGGTATRTEEEPTEEASEEPTEEPEENISETGSRGRIPDLVEQEEEGEGEQSSRRSSSNDAEDLGLVASDEYLSPQFDVDVAWDDRWEFDPDIVDEPIASDTSEGIDWITLAWTDGSEGDITITFASTEDFAPELMVEYWESDDYIDQFEIPAEVLLAESSADRGAVMLLFDDGADGYVLYQEAVCMDRRCEEYALVTIFAPAADAADVIADAEEGVDVAGEGATGVFSLREIRRALDN